MLKKITLHSVEETEAFAKDFIEKIVPVSEGATVVCLYGDLGSGKTTFVQTAAKSLGITNIVTSPTFVIEKKYDLDTSNFDTLYHIDAYRLKSGKELLALGWNEMIKNTKNIIFIEWPKYVRDVLPANVYEMEFKFVDENTREVVIGDEIYQQDQ